MKIIICLTLVFFSIIYKTQASSESYIKRIININPKIEENEAKTIEHFIDLKVRKYKLPKEIFFAILAQESKFTLTNRCKPGSKKGILINGKICTDFGISQIHYKSVKNYKFDVHQLNSNLKYSVEAGAIVLNDMRKLYSKNDKEWYTRYNASNPIKRKAYKKAISEFMVSKK